MKTIHFFLILLPLLFSFSRLTESRELCEAEVNGTCTACRAGFSLNSSKNCTCTVSNCQNCSADSNNNSICSVCSMYFGLLGLDNSSCKSCYLDGCMNCSLSAEGLPICINCTDGYYLQGGKCMLCSDYLAGCSKCSYNGTFKCQGCLDSGFYSNGTSCVACGSDSNTINCSKCNNDYFYFSSGYYCYECKENFTMTSDIERGICENCSSVIPHCAQCSMYYKSCDLCEDGYNMNYSEGVYRCDPECSEIGNCSLCPSSYCSKCKAGYYMNDTNDCVLCSENGTTQANCLKPICYNGLNYNLGNGFFQDCEVCASGFVNLYPKTGQAISCINCSQNISNCAECTFEYYGQAFASCSKCSVGYKLQLESNYSYTCVQNCSSTHFWHDNQLCVLCTDVGDYCDSCNQTHCLSCKSPSLTLLNPETNSLCSLCDNLDTDTNETVNNKTYCRRKTKVVYKNFTSVSGNVSFNISCSVSPSKIMFVYGPTTSVNDLSLEKDVQPKLVGNKNYTNIPSTSDTEWVGFGGRFFNTTANNYSQITLIPPLKASGESFSIRIWCQNLMNSSDVSNNSIQWTQPSNGGKKTRLSVFTNAELTSNEKKKLGYSIKKALKLTNDMYSDTGDLVPSNITSLRLLQDSTSNTSVTSYTNTFVVIPDFTSSEDNSANLINQTLQNSTAFLASVTAVLTSINAGSSFTVSSITSITVNATTSIQPVLANVNFKVNGNTLTISFNLTNTNGIFYAGAESTTYGLVLANLSSANLYYPNWNLFKQGKNYSSLALTKFTNVSALAGQSSQISFSNLDSNKTYLVYYGAASDEIPPVYTFLYVNVSNTIENSGGDSSNGVLRIYSWICFLSILIYSILN